MNYVKVFALELCRVLVEERRTFFFFALFGLMCLVVGLLFFLIPGDGLDFRTLIFTAYAFGIGQFVLILAIPLLICSYVAGPFLSNKPKPEI